MKAKTAATVIVKAKVTRNDGTVEDLGEISRTKTKLRKRKVRKNG